MSAFILTFLAVLLSGLGARDQLTLAGLARVQGGRPALLVVAVLLSMVTAAFAGWAATQIAPLMAANARLLMAALALGFAGIECLLLPPSRTAREPTRSVAALAIVMAAHQLTDAARFLIFAVGLAVNAPFAAAAGGAVGGMLLLGAAWAAPEYFTWQKLRKSRRAIGAGLLIPALYLGLRAMGQM
jgi:Ca2+/H+ antiporter, TMEM165/GDT1 family